MTLTSLPVVDGRHRNRALAAARRARAVELRTHGWTYQAIATELGFANKGTVYAIVRKALAQEQAANVHQLRQLEGDRLDLLHAALWARAMNGDLNAARQVLAIIKARCKLYGLEGAVLGGDGPEMPQTLVVPPC